MGNKALSFEGFKKVIINQVKLLIFRGLVLGTDGKVIDLMKKENPISLYKTLIQTRFMSG